MRSLDDPCDAEDLSKIFRRAETEMSINNKEEQQYALLYVTVSAIHTGCFIRTVLKYGLITA